MATTSMSISREAILPSPMTCRYRTNWMRACLEQTGVIPHPNGLNWYHSHLHGRSSDQVMGGLWAPLVGDAKANVVACKPNPADPTKCLNDVDANTELKARTDVRYALLRDIALKNITALPIAAGDKSADWAPEDKDWKQKLGECKVWLGAGGQGIEDAKHRLGYCQREESKAWLFTLNGQRFPTITVDGGRNVLLRLGNLSANVVYWLELQNKDDEIDILPLTLLSVDGVVVPSKPVDVTAPDLPVRAFPVKDLLLMPASRAEILRPQRLEAPGAEDLRPAHQGPDSGIDPTWCPLLTAAMILSGSAVHVNGLGSWFVSATKRLMVAWRSTTHRKTPRFSLRLASLAKNPSTALSHEHEVGVKWKVKRGCRSSH